MGDDISKALTIGGKLQVEPLDTVLKHVTFDANKLTLWPKLPRCSCPPFNSINLEYVNYPERHRSRVELFDLLHKLMHKGVYGD